MGVGLLTKVKRTRRNFRKFPKVEYCGIFNPRFREKVPVTVCIATLFRWNYAQVGEPPRVGLVAIALSDRMITAGDVQYEPAQLKVAFMSDRALLMIAGDYSTHSQAIHDTHLKMRGIRNPSPYSIAQNYGQSIQAIKRKQAEDIYLAPLGLNSDSFLAEQKEMSADFVSNITSQLQNHQGPDVEALIVGADGNNAHIYLVDSQGSAHCLDDVGFGAIGIGAWHAKSRLMQARYSNSTYYAYSLAVAFAAKKAAEIAPGVGSRTDIHLVFKDKIEAIDPNVDKRIHDLYTEYLGKLSGMGAELIEQLDKDLPTLSKKLMQVDEKNERESGRDAKSDESAIPDESDT
ncbi:hypothetical protein [Bradyrhizobium canariense]|uniref:Uncharacterized protein n=1 Tax=Bradyrhizobium canariense TaxID=255045 RepID=A0A1H2BQ09_9BRAD|nr:hypothetical protein [Bradyrhizobium canariense]SDT60298.1 hypothetical protein SAMN05444158_7419 [Bradyrhizobium canariense]